MSLPTRAASVLVATAALVLPGCTDILDDPVAYGAIEVSATRRSGEPVPGVWLLLYNGQREVDLGTTGEDGLHRFEFVPPQSYGVYAGPPGGYARPEELTGGPFIDRIDRIDIEEGLVEQISFTFLKVGPGTVEVTVRDTDGVAVEGIPIALYSTERSLATLSTDRAGLARFEGVPYGNVAIAAKPPTSFQEPGQTTIVRDGLIIEEGLVVEVDIEVQPCSGRIAVEVVDGSGWGVAGAFLELYRASGGLASATTDAAGTHAFTGVQCEVSHGVKVLPPGGYSVTEGAGSSYFDGLVVAPDEQLSVRFTLQPA